MRYGSIIVAATAALGLLIVSPATAQMGGGRGPGRGARVYNPQTVETIHGEIVKVEHVSGPGKGYGVHLTLKTDSGEVSVHLGPAHYVERQGLTLAAKDQVEVRGSRVTLDGQPVVIAAELKKGEQVLKLRDDAGVPLWRGRKPR